MKKMLHQILFNNDNIGYSLFKVVFDIKRRPFDYKCQDANAAFGKFFAANKKEIIGQHLSNFNVNFPDLMEKLHNLVVHNTPIDYYSYIGNEKIVRIMSTYNKKNNVCIVLFEEKGVNLELKDYRNRLNIILEVMQEGIYGVDKTGKCIFCNSKCLTLLGYSKPEELIGKDMNKITHQHSYSDSPEFITDIVDRIFSDKMRKTEHEVYLRKDGSYFYAEYKYYPLFEQEKVVGAIIVFTDVSDRKTLEQELKESERSKSVILENLPGMAYRCKFDEEWTMLFVSKGCLELTGYPTKSFLYNKELSFSDIIIPEHKERVWNVWNAAIGSRESVKEEYIIITANGEEKWVFEQGQIVYGDDNEVIAVEGLIIDINEQKQKQREIEYLSYHDNLTGLYNRSYFERMQQQVNTANNLPITLFVGDINGLKLINDALGHQEGDALIIRTANILQEACSDKHILARTGGDEFSILMPKTDAYHANLFMRKIQRLSDEHNKEIKNEVYHINISVGFATKTKLEQSFNKLRKVAEDYMYRRKLLNRKSSHSAIISSIKSSVYAKSQETEEHAERMQILSRLVAKKMNLAESQLDDLLLLAALHDIGKIGIEDSILKKPGPLTDVEWLEMKKHPEIGYRIAMAAPELIPIANYILCHHERWDGKGYPQGLKGTEIPLLSRIIAVIDAYDAMTQDRPYRKALSKLRAIQEITDNSGTQFDPEAARVFIEVIKEYQDVKPAS